MIRASNAYQNFPPRRLHSQSPFHISQSMCQCIKDSVHVLEVNNVDLLGQPYYFPMQIPNVPRLPSVIVDKIDSFQRVCTNNYVPPSTVVPFARPPRWPCPQPGLGFAPCNLHNLPQEANLGSFSLSDKMKKNHHTQNDKIMHPLLPQNFSSKYLAIILRMLDISQEINSGRTLSYLFLLDEVSVWGRQK